MAGVTTAMPTSFKKELMEGLHHLSGTVVIVGTTVNASQGITGLANVNDISAGMGVTDASGDIPAGTFVSKITSGTAVGIDKIMTAGHAAQNITFKGDSLAFALIKVGPTGTYGAASTNYSNITGNADEIPNGSGYTTGGFVWATGAQITPATSGTGAFGQPSTNPSWTAATISTIGGMLYNVTQPGNAIAVESFGGTQTVTAGTLTLLLPSNGVGTSLLQVN